MVAVTREEPISELGQRAIHTIGAAWVDLASVPLRLVAPLLEPVRADIDRSVRRAIGAQAPRTAGRSAPVENGNGTDGALAGRRRPNRHGPRFLPPDAVARRVHGDFPSMMIGGMAALLLQTLHPLTMAGVAEHSRYADDPMGRLRRTAAFISATTFGTVEDAEAAIDGVRTVHATVRGRAPDGRLYSADAPDLLTWVHAAETASFLGASRRYGVAHLASGDADRYLAETAEVALRLGAEWVPRSEDELDSYFHYVRPQLYAGPQALSARNFLIRGVARRPDQRMVHACIAAAAIGLLPAWARDALRLPTPPLIDRTIVVPAAWTLCQGLRWAIRPQDDRPNVDGASEDHRQTADRPPTDR